MYLDESITPSRHKVPAIDVHAIDGGRLATIQVPNQGTIINLPVANLVWNCFGCVGGMCVCVGGRDVCGWGDVFVREECVWVGGMCL